MLMFEIEYTDPDGPPEYIYIQTEDDMDIDVNEGCNITHITTVDTDLGIEPDMIIKRRID